MFVHMKKNTSYFSDNLLFLESEWISFDLEDFTNSKIDLAWSI